ncbi:MAG: hypothetical protein E1N59_2916 [Puniceicoccaceae bacterium 5H]|nr:MAG: hypothetical protein E1N59_2916 [Puniceicoccaceae bacterium 5H]
MPDFDHIDAHLDTLFQRAAPPTRPDFAAQVKARLHEDSDEQWLEDEIEAHLAAWPVEPAEDFTPRTLERLRADQPKVIRFPQWASLTGAAAAAVLFAFGALQLGETVPTGAPTQPATLAAAQERPTTPQFARISDRRASAQAAGIREPDWDEETAAVLALTDYVAPASNASQMSEVDLEALALLAAE